MTCSAATYIATASAMVPPLLPREFLRAQAADRTVGIWYPGGGVLNAQTLGGEIESYNGRRGGGEGREQGDAH